MNVFIESFGINALSLLWYLVIFTVVFLLLRRFAFGPVVGAIEKRQAEINRSLDEAAEARESVKRNRERAEEVLQEASSQAQEIIRRAERAAAELHEDARREARTQADAIVARARTEIDRERAQAVAEIKAQVVDLALSAASRVVEANLDAPANRRLVEETLARAELRA